MKKFLLRLALFLLPIVLTAYFADVYLSDKLKQSNSFATKEYPVWNALFDGNVDADVLVYGSSRAWVHFDAQMIADSMHRSVYNLGIDGHNFRLQYLRHQLVMKHNKKPKLIILSVDDLTLFTRDDLYNAEQFLPYFLWNTDLFYTTRHYNGLTPYDFAIPLVRYYGQLAAFKEIKRLANKPGENVPQRVRGYQGQDAQWSSDLSKIKPFHAPVDELTALFVQFLTECKKAKIDVVMVYSPENIEGQRMVINRSEIMALYSRYADEFKIPFYDYSSHPLSMQRTYFYNAMHLNKTGSRLFTADLIGKLALDPKSAYLFSN